MSEIVLRSADYLPSANLELNYGIGLVGCGNIARNAHLPAYRKYGYRVVAAVDVSREAVERAQKEFDIPFATTEIDEFLQQDGVDIVDLAVPAQHRLPLVRKIARAGKPILSQKPFAMKLSEAEAMVAICEEAGVPLMINQQARWAPAHRAAKLLLDRDLIGHLYSVFHLRRSFQDTPGTWYVDMEDFNIVDHGIHYIDLARFFTGRTPARVKATTTMAPGQHAVTPMIYTINCEYEPGADLMATLHFNNIVATPELHRYEWFLDGTEGSIAANDGEVVLATRGEPGTRHVFSMRGTWFPDAFAGSMAEMMRAVHERRAPETSGRDNLDSIRVAFAAVESAKTGASVPLDPLHSDAS